MVAAKDGDPAAVADLQGDKQGNGLDAVVAPVHVVTHKEIVCVWRLAPNPEQLHEVVKLAVHIAANRHRALDRLNIALFRQNLFRFLAKNFHLQMQQTILVHPVTVTNSDH